MGARTFSTPKAYAYEGSFDVKNGNTTEFTVLVKTNGIVGIISVMKTDAAGTVTQRQNWTEIGTVPAIAIPRDGQIVKLYTPADNVLFATIQVLANGQVRIITPEISSAKWLQGSALYML